MKRYYFLIYLLLSAGLSACTKDSPEALRQDAESSLITKTSLPSPKIVAMIETNDVNPLNVMDYYCEDGYPFFDIVELFAANIHKETVNGQVRPTLYLNDKLAPILEGGLDTYVRPLQVAG